MGIKTYSGFIYGHTITDNNKYIDFNEGSGDLVAVVEVGSYSFGDFANAVAIALNNAGTLDYSVLADRTTRRITISTTANFDLLVTAGDNLANSTFPLLGFTTDRSGSTSYEGDEQSGSFYEPQNILQRYVDYEDNKKTTNASKNQTVSGAVEVVSYGKVNFMECNITPITDITPQLSIKDNANAVSEFRSFMGEATNKTPMEFIKDLDNPGTFVKTILESTRESRDGVDFKIKELFQRRLFGYYESGTLVFRELE